MAKSLKQKLEDTSISPSKMLGTFYLKGSPPLLPFFLNYFSFFARSFWPFEILIAKEDSVGITLSHYFD